MKVKAAAYKYQLPATRRGNAAGTCSCSVDATVALEVSL